jgi:hypothetical protein
MYDPFFETTYNGTREGDDWVGYWDEATSLSQTSADAAYSIDLGDSATVPLFSGEAFFTKFNVPKYATYIENGSGQYFISANPDKRASFADATARHGMIYSRYHKSKYFCSTCHDVANAAAANLGLSDLIDQSGGVDLISEQYPSFAYFHVERTFSEFMLSEYAVQGGAATNPEFQAMTGGIDWVARCQDCHMMDVVGKGADKKDAILRPTESTEHPNSGQPLHDMTGGNCWISHILASLDPNGPVYDEVNVQILDQGPAVLTLDLLQGETPVIYGAELKAGSDRAKDQLRLAATLKDLAYDRSTGEISFKVQNNTGHKLISGFPEGRRMFVNIIAYVGDSIIYEVNPYDYTVGTLRGLSYSQSSPPLGPNEEYVDEVVYETQMSSALTGEEKTFHFVLATDRYKDNRIPPKGFDISGAAERVVVPRWHGDPAPDYFTTEEYLGGYDDVTLNIGAGADEVEVNLYYQGTSREYIEFLRDEINGTATTLSSPTPSGEEEAYIVQTDPFLSQLKAWGDAIWDLWYHNHGLDGIGTPIDGIVPYRMTSANWVYEGVTRTLDVSSTEGGTVTQPGEGIFYYDDAVIVDLEAAADANYHFVEWTGTGVDAEKVAEPSSPTTTITMDGDYTLIANFAIDQHTLTISSTAGGSVIVPGEGAFQYDHGTAADIQAAADPGHFFAYWIGTAVDAGKVADPSSASTTVTVDADYTVEAVFATVDITDISIDSATGAISIVWTSINGKTYAVHYSNGPMDVSMTWTLAETGIAASGTGTNTWTDDGSLTGGLPALERYYKVEVLPN